MQAVLQPVLLATKSSFKVLCAECASHNNTSCLVCSTQCSVSHTMEYASHTTLHVGMQHPMEGLPAIIGLLGARPVIESSTKMMGLVASQVRENWESYNDEHLQKVDGKLTNTSSFICTKIKWKPEEGGYSGDCKSEPAPSKHSLF